MITTQQSIAIKKYLGKQYSPKIIEWLNKRNIFNANSESYKADSIHNIVKGKQANAIVEDEIFKLIAKVKKEKAVVLEKRKSIIKK